MRCHFELYESVNYTHSLPQTTIQHYSMLLLYLCSIQLSSTFPWCFQTGELSKNYEICLFKFLTTSKKKVGPRSFRTTCGIAWTYLSGSTDRSAPNDQFKNGLNLCLDLLNLRLKYRILKQKILWICVNLKNGN